MLKRLVVLSVFLTCALCIPSRADTITDPSNGVSYTLTYSTTANPNVLNLKLVVDTTQYSKSSNNKLVDIALALRGNGADVADFTLTGSPASYLQPQAGGLGGNGCGGNEPTYICDNYSGPGDGLSVGNVYTWDWAFTGSLDELITASHIRAQYTGRGANNTSKDITLTGPPITPVPQPATLLMLGSGLLAGATFLRRRILSRH